MSEYEAITKEHFEQFLNDNYCDEWIQIHDKYSREFVYSVKSKMDNLFIRIYSSIDIRSGKSRPVGQDAIRFILWNAKENRPIGKTTRVNRIGEVWDRINSRISILKKKSTTVNMIDYNYILALLYNPVNVKNNFALSLRQQLEKRKFLSKSQLNCIIGKGSGRSTIEQRVLKQDPLFLTRYQEQEDVELEKEIKKEESIAAHRKEIINNNLLVVDKQDEDIELVSTEGYPYSYKYFNKLQSRVFPYINEDCNMVVAGNTSSGKTICAELLMHKVLSEGRKVIYLSPLKALTQEKYKDWQKTFSKHKIVITTGDYQMTKALQKKIAEADIILMTSEMLDSRTRMIEAEKNFWFYEVGLLVVDEVHILGQVGDRGHPMEVGIMRFTKINPTCQVSFLSATMPNVSELGLWLTILNEKKTIVINSSWRPVELNKHYITYEEVRYGKGGFMNYKATQNRKISEAVRILRSKPDQKFLVFCHDKNAGRLLMQTFSRISKEDISFHSADLSLTERLELENRFTHGTLRILVSTPTLAWGKNMPARNVISVGVHRGLTEIDELDLIQMAGRAGRPQYDDEGDVYFLVPKQEMSKWKSVIENPKDIISGLKRIDALAFHILGAIHVGDIYKSEDSFEWYKRSLAHLQSSEFTAEDLEEVLDSLLQRDMVTHSSDDKLILTGLGKVSVFFYFSPYDVYEWYSNFKKIMEIDVSALNNDYLISWAMASIPSNDPGFSRKNIIDGNLASWISFLKQGGIDITQSTVNLGNVLPSIMAFHNCLTGVESTKEPLVIALARSIRQDIGRSTNAVSLIDSMFARWSRKDPNVTNFFDALELRTKYGVDYKLLDLVRIPNIGSKRAVRLYNAGYKNVSDLDIASMEDLTLLIGEKTANRVKTYIGNKTR